MEKVGGNWRPLEDNWTRWEPEIVEPEKLFWFENVNTEFWYWFQNRYWWIFWVLIGFYWLATYICTEFMKNRAPIDNQTFNRFMFVYNLGVTLFSITAFWRLSTTFFPNLFSSPNGLHSSICERGHISQKDVFWLVAFAWSKVFHLMDTFYLILRKKPVPLFQMYHHSVTVLVPQHIMPFGEPILFWWGLTNLLQHSLLYPFYAFKAIKVKLPQWISTLLVTIEVLQMLVGLGTGLYTVQVLNSGGDCMRHPKSIKVFNFVYLTFTGLAVQMAYDHLRKKSKEKLV